MRFQSHSRSRSGFTLVELLVVIAIIAVLTALVTSISVKMIASGRSAKDLGQLRDLGVGFNSYAGEQGHFPLSESMKDGSNWMDQLRGDMNLTFEGSSYTPADAEPFISARLNAKVGSGNPSDAIKNLSHYAAVTAILAYRTDEWGYSGVPSVAVKRPTEIALLVSAQIQGDALKNAPRILVDPFYYEWYSPEDKPSTADVDDIANEERKFDPAQCESAHIDFRNNGKAYVLYTDGHVDKLSPNDFYYRMFTNAY